MGTPDQGETIAVEGIGQEPRQMHSVLEDRLVPNRPYEEGSSQNQGRLVAGPVG